MTFMKITQRPNQKQHNCEKEQAKSIRLIVLGDSKAGKTSLILRYTDNTFATTFSTTLGVDFKVKQIQVEDKPYKFEIWDTGGQERFRTIAKSYYDRAMGVLLVYDCSDEKSFANIRNWVNSLENHAHVGIVKILIAAKCDLPEKKISSATAKALATELKMEFFETSSKLNKNVEQAFTSIAEQIMKKEIEFEASKTCLLYTSPSPRDATLSRMPSSA
eukprot:TRINITY_DN1396_c0_g1_i4.p1 TRINITY_DN1396_c0_g1~~TRINITY_DN1396_c0_g1_i4.p1  ORF type:complete len:218 (-),score=40.20 TRINITY_DN1396_c0_g1_i4:14-667(-)